MKGLAFILLLFITIPVFGQNVFVSEKFGFSIAEPAGWVKITDKKLDYNLGGSHGYHVISFSKYDPKKHKGFNPIISIITGVNWMPFKQLSEDMLSERNHKNRELHNFSTLQKPEIIYFKSLEAISRVDQYTIRGRNGGKFLARRKSYVVPSRHYVFHIDFVDAPASEDEAKLFEALAESIKFGKNYKTSP